MGFFNSLPRGDSTSLSAHSSCGSPPRGNSAPCTRGGAVRPEAVIDRGAMAHNLGRVRALAPGRKVMAVIKANGYGHGLLRVAEALQGADAFGVARLEEALALRDGGIRQRLVLLEGVFSGEELESALRHRLDTVLHDRHQLQVLAAHREAARLSVWLKVDTGMNRLGFRPEEVTEVLAALRHMPVVGEILLMTHLACADRQEGEETPLQLERFASVSRGFGGELSVANSAGILAWPDSHGHWVRPGLMLYGASPFEGRDGEAFGLRPAMTLRTRLLAIRELRAGECVGYGGSWRAPEAMRLGVAAIGYGDGYP
ncbi:MAG TPA: alanine racemase, partial [Thiotrichales bacterium]|nr:alanine racemase [Thiotrichales bacterium]